MNPTTLSIYFNYDIAIIARIKGISSAHWNIEARRWEISIWDLPKFEEKFPQVPVAENIRKAFENFHAPVSQNLVKEVAGFKTPLYPFQLVGVTFLSNKNFALLADSMGLGKSPQAIATCLELEKKYNISKALIVCPASVKIQWGTEIKKFTDKTYTVIDGSPKKREVQWTNTSFFTVVTYDTVKADLDLILQNNYDVIILDECSYIKNHAAARTKAIKKVPARFKYALSGTPIVNNVLDLHSVFSFLAPHFLENINDFKTKYVCYEQRGWGFKQWKEITGFKNLDELHNKIKPVFLRRKKEEVMKDLPSLTTEIRRIELGKTQAELYRKIKTKLQESIHMGDTNNIAPGFNMMRMVCDSSELVNLSDSDLKNALFDKEIFSVESTKLDELVDILKNEVSEEKIIVFTQWKRMAHIIANRLGQEGIKCILITGDSDKAAEIAKFKKGEADVIVSTDALAFGVNLQEASVVVHFSLAWTPATLEQRLARSHRIGQHLPVTEIFIVANSSVEDKVLKLLQDKKSLINSVVENREEDILSNTELMKQLIED